MEPPRLLNAVLDVPKIASALAMEKLTGALLGGSLESVSVALSDSGVVPGGQYQPLVLPEPAELAQFCEMLASLKK